MSVQTIYTFILKKFKIKMPFTGLEFLTSLEGITHFKLKTMKFEMEWLLMVFDKDTIVNKINNILNYYLLILCALSF